MKYSLRSLMIVVALTAVLLSVAAGGFRFFREQGEIIQDAYSIDWASAMIVQYMDDNDGRYPTQWSDLRQPFEKIIARDKSFTFEDIQARVAIDFSADALDTGRPFVKLNSGRGVYWGGVPEPNERIRARIAQGDSIAP